MLLRDLGFIEEVGEYVLDSGIKNKMKKIKSWLRKGVKKVKEMMVDDMDEEELVEGLANDKIDIDEIIA